MYDITKTRMLLTTAVVAAVSALCASGANASFLIPDDTSSAGAAQESLRIGRYVAQTPSRAKARFLIPADTSLPAQRRSRSGSAATSHSDPSDTGTETGRIRNEPPRFAAPLSRLVTMR